MPGIVLLAAKQVLSSPRPLPASDGLSSGLTFALPDSPPSRLAVTPSPWAVLEDFPLGWAAGWAGGIGGWARETGLPTHNGDAVGFLQDTLENEMHKACAHALTYYFRLQVYCTGYADLPGRWLFGFGTDAFPECYGVEVEFLSGVDSKVRVGQCIGPPYFADYSEGHVALALNTVYDLEVQWNSLTLISASINSVSVSHTVSRGVSTGDIVLLYKGYVGIGGGHDLHVDYIRYIFP